MDCLTAKDERWFNLLCMKIKTNHDLLMVGSGIHLSIATVYIIKEILKEMAHHYLHLACIIIPIMTYDRPTCWIGATVRNIYHWRRMTICYRYNALCRLLPVSLKNPRVIILLSVILLWQSGPYSVDCKLSTKFLWWLTWILILIQAIDLDQIVSEHYERSCSQQNTQVTNRVGIATPPSVQSKVCGAPVGVCNAENSASSLKTCAHGVQVGHSEQSDDKGRDDDLVIHWAITILLMFNLF